MKDWFCILIKGQDRNYWVEIHNLNNFWYCVSSRNAKKFVSLRSARHCVEDRTSSEFRKTAVVYRFPWWGFGLIKFKVKTWER